MAEVVCQIGDFDAGPSQFRSTVTGCASSFSRYLARYERANDLPSDLPVVGTPRVSNWRTVGGGSYWAANTPGRDVSRQG